MRLARHRRYWLAPPPRAACGEHRALAHRLYVVEISQHARVRFRSEQQVLETAEYMRPDRLALHRRGIQRSRALVGGNREMIGPEMHQPFAEASVGGRGHAITRADLGQEILSEVLAEAHLELLDGVLSGVGHRRPIRGSLRHVRSLRPSLCDARPMVGNLALQIVEARGQSGHFRRRRHARRNLLEQPCARIVDGLQFSGLRSQPEPVEDGCGLLGRHTALRNVGSVHFQRSRGGSVDTTPHFRRRPATIIEFPSGLARTTTRHAGRGIPG